MGRKLSVEGTIIAALSCFCVLLIVGTLLFCRHRTDPLPAESQAVQVDACPIVIKGWPGPGDTSVSQCKVASRGSK